MFEGVIPEGYGAGIVMHCIKHGDRWSGALDITAFAPLSVTSGGDVTGILAQDDSAIRRTNRPASSRRVERGPAGRGRNARRRTDRR